MQTVLEFFRENRGRFSHVLLDVDGTVCYQRSFIPGAESFLRYLREAEIPFYFLTNNATNTAAQQVEKFHNLGFELREDQFISSRDPVGDYLRSLNLPEQRYFLVGIHTEIPGVVRFERDLSKLEECDGVLYNGGADFDCRAMLTALLNFFIRHPERPFIVPNTDSLNPVANGVTICPGGWSKIVVDLLKSHGIEKQRVQFGKPLRAIYEYARKHIGLPADADLRRVLVVGDLLSGDILGANDYGFTSALVLTGLTTLEMAESATGKLKPNYIFSSLG